MSFGKIPALEGPGIKLTETIAIVYVSRSAPASPQPDIVVPLLHTPSFLVAYSLLRLISLYQYLSKLDPKSNLLGSAGTLAQESQVLSYVSFANQELLAALARWFIPLLPGADPATYNHDAIEAGKKASLTLLEKLETALNGVEWLVGDGPTLADIFVAVILSRGLQWVLGREWREAHPASVAHFERVRNWAPVKKVIPEFTLVEVEPVNVQPAKTS